jgi:hypothetical protein
MDILTIFDEIRKRPGLLLDGDKSLKRVRSFVVGYDMGAQPASGGLTDLEQFHEFNDWVAKRLGYSNSTRGWCNMILEKAGSDEKAYEMFFELIDKFRRRRKRSTTVE